MKSDGNWYAIDGQNNDVKFYLLNKKNKVEIYNQDEVLIGQVDGNWDESDEESCNDMAFDIEEVINNYLGI